MNIEIDVTYTCGLNTLLELPIKDWSEIKAWYIKWNTFYYTLDDKTWHEEELNCGDSENIDWKRPDSIVIQDENYETLEAIP